MSRGKPSPNISSAEFPVLVLRVLYAMTPPQTAKALNRSERTVKNHWGSIRKKLGVPKGNKVRARIWILNEFYRGRFGS